MKTSDELKFGSQQTSGGKKWLVSDFTVTRYDTIAGPHIYLWPVCYIYHRYVSFDWLDVL